jgi:hypothetical protein
MDLVKNNTDNICQHNEPNIKTRKLRCDITYIRIAIETDMFYVT